MIDTKILSVAMDLAIGRLKYHFIDTREQILATKLDRVVSRQGDTPSWLVKITDGNEVWIKDGLELEREEDISNNRYTLPMSQY